MKVESRRGCDVEPQVRVGSRKDFWGVAWKRCGQGCRCVLEKRRKSCVALCVGCAAVFGMGKDVVCGVVTCWVGDRDFDG